MSLKIHWQVEDEEGVLPLRGGQAWVLYVDGLLDRLSRPPSAEEDGFSARADGAKVELEASGGFSFVVGGKRGRKVLLPSGGAVDFEVGVEAGSLRISGGEAAADPLVGREVAGYRLLGRLGSGAVGVVYRALQTSLDREVALKILNSEASKDPDKVTSFRREAIAAGRLSHPNLVQVHDVGDEGELHFYSMELVPGGTLEDRLREAGPMSWRESVRAVRDAALALAFAESHHLVHRDVKPENLMFTSSGHVKLADLGLATTRGMIDREGAGGTPHFMAPESIHPEGVDHRADLYSLGCTLFRLATGDTVFHGDSVRDILRAHRELDPPSLRDVGVHAPREAENLLRSLLAKDPGDRPADARQVAEICERVLAHQKQRRGLGLALSLVLVSAVAVVAVRSMQEDPVVDPLAGVEGPDPEAQRLAAESRAQREVQRTFTAAMELADGEPKSLALLSFLAAYPEHALASTARGELERLEAQRQAAADPTDPGPPPEAGPTPAWLALQAEVGGLLEQQRFGAALARIDAAAAVAAQDGSLRQGVLGQAALRLAALEEEHRGQLEAEDWDRAAAHREAFAAATAGAPGAEGRDWNERLRLLAAAAEDGLRRAAAAQFAEARRELARSLQELLPPACALLDAAAAEDAFRRTLEGCSHDGLLRAGASSQDFLAAAARASEALWLRIQTEGPLEITEALDGKRAELLAAGPDGLRVRVQVRGERVQRLDPWAPYLKASVLPTFLDEVSPPAASRADLAALQLLVAADHAGARLRQLAGELPEPAAAAGWATELRLATALRRELAETPAWLERELVALDRLAGFAEALGRGDDYSALLRFEDFLRSFNLAAVLGSDGHADWGLEP